MTATRKSMLAKAAKKSARDLLRLSFLFSVLLFWTLVGSRYEPFRSHRWLSMLGLFLTEVLALGVVVLLFWLLEAIGVTHLRARIPEKK